MKSDDLCWQVWLYLLYDFCAENILIAPEPEPTVITVEGKKTLIISESKIREIIESDEKLMFHQTIYNLTGKGRNKNGL